MKKRKAKPLALGHAARHVASLRAPNEELDDHGRRIGTTTTLASNIFCSIEPLSGGELENAQKQYARATFRVKIPAWDMVALPITTRHHLFLAERAQTLEIGYVSQPDQIAGGEVVLLCGEYRQ